jgi:hypothetical protein
VQGFGSSAGAPVPGVATDSEAARTISGTKAMRRSGKVAEP